MCSVRRAGQYLDVTTTASPRRGGRPIGSTSGRVPPAGYPTVPPQLGAFLAGLIEGEASFSIAKQPRNENHRCLFSLTMRADDEALLTELAQATALGRITSVPARNTSNPQTDWHITAKSDCLRLCEILDRYPLRGRKSLDYAIWCAAVNWWTGGRPTKTWRHRDWTPMRYLKCRLQEARCYVNEARSIGPDCYAGLEGDWLSFFSGFLTAEGHLGITRNNGSYFAPKAQIAVRADDLPLLRELRERVGVGRIYRGARRQTSSPSGLWMVRDGHGLRHLVEVLDGCPPRGRRGREYRIWREAVLEYASGKPRTEIRERLRQLRHALASERQMGSRSGGSPY